MDVFVSLTLLLFLDFLITSQMRYLRYCYFYKKAGEKLLDYWQYNFDWTITDVDKWEMYPAFLLHSPNDSSFLNRTRLQANLWLFLKKILNLLLFVLFAPFVLCMLVGTCKAVF